jgi:[acyl-carrier-protein] S-malonyltransferase
VIAGHKAAVERAMIGAKEAGAKRALLLPVSVPSHCALMFPAAEKLAEALENITILKPNSTLIHNVDVLSHSSPELISHALKEQLYKPVRWVDTIKFMSDQGVTSFVECGAGKVLIGLNKRIAKDAEHFALYDTETMNNVMEQLND